MNTTHIVYSFDRDTQIYFNGSLTDMPDVIDIDFEWTEDINRATLLPCPDAWGLLRYLRNTYKNVRCEVKRIRNFEEI